MAAYDWDALRRALSSASLPSHKRREPNHRAICELLLRWGIANDAANTVSKNELCYWEVAEVEAIFRKLNTPASAIKAGLRSFDNAGNVPKNARSSDFIKPDTKLMLQSVDKRAALCVNEHGQFSLRDTDYVAISHVWIQGVGADLDNRGLPRSLVRSIFARLKPINVQWIWLDSLAIPGGVEKLSVHEEDLKVSLINCLADVYRKAKAIVILDALVLRLKSTDAAETAIMLCCGSWITRMWTYQEIKLAVNAIVVTGSGFVSWKDMFDELEKKTIGESGEVKMDHPDRFSRLTNTMGRLFRNDDIGVSLPDLAIGCGYRKAGEPLDYARALFPTLRLTWKSNYNIEEGMKNVYLSQKDHATRLALYHGPPRHHWPGWAPATFSNLIDSLVLEESHWARRGLMRRWFTAKINRILPSKPGALVLALDNGNGTETLSGCKISEFENPKSVLEFRNAVERQSAYLLSDIALHVKKPFAHVGLLVERFTAAKELEAWVYMTTAVFDTEPTYNGKTEKWLLLHENPVSEHYESGKEASELHYLFELKEQTIGSAEDGETALHVAARSGDDAETSRFAQPGPARVNQRDGRGWTALHSAASAGHSNAVRILARSGATMNAFDNEGRSALVLAVEKGHTDTVVELLEAGTDVNASDPRGWSPICAAIMTNQLEMLTLLLALGADPSAPDKGGWSPLIFAIASSDQINKDRALLDTLLEAGADPKVANIAGLTPLESAARGGDAYAAERLIAHGASPNEHLAGDLTPLFYAIQEQSENCVSVLLENGADANVLFPGAWTPVLHAAKIGNLDILRQLKAMGANLSHICVPEGWSALHLAAQAGHRTAVKWLLEEDVDKELKDADGKTAMDLAITERHLTVVSALGGKT